MSLIITKGWHRLFTGGNGLITNGLEITNTDADSVKSGYAAKFSMNDYSFQKDSQRVMQSLNLSQELYDKYLAELNDLVAEQAAEKAEQARIDEANAKVIAKEKNEEKKRLIVLHEKVIAGLRSEIEEYEKLNPVS
jgi:hypothetical protein